MKNKKVIQVFDIFMYTVFLFPIVTILTANGVTNKILFALLIISYVIMIARSKFNRKDFMITVVALIGFLISVLNTEFPLVNANMLFYYPFIIIYMFFTRNYNNEIKIWLLDEEKFVRGVMKIWNVIVGISAFIPNCYYVKEGGERYFGSFVQTIFRLGPASIFIMAIVIISISLYKNKKDIIYFSASIYSCLMGSSRTYLVLAIILFLIGLYMVINSPKNFIITLIPVVAVITLVVVNSSIYKKILYTFDDKQYGDFWFRVTSSRSELWEKDLRAWNKLSLFKRIFGGGLNFTYSVSSLWGHNDFVEILCANGILGTIIYSYVLLKCILGFKQKIPFLMKLAVLIVWVLNAFFNMHYTYFCCVLALPFLLIAVDNYYNNKEHVKLKYNEK